MSELLMINGKYVVVNGKLSFPGGPSTPPDPSLLDIDDAWGMIPRIVYYPVNVGNYVVIVSNYSGQTVSTTDWRTIDDPSIVSELTGQPNSVQFPSYEQGVLFVGGDGSINTYTIDSGTGAISATNKGKDLGTDELAKPLVYANGHLAGLIYEGSSQYRLNTFTIDNSLGDLTHQYTGPLIPDPHSVTPMFDIEAFNEYVYIVARYESSIGIETFKIENDGSINFIERNWVYDSPSPITYSALAYQNEKLFVSYDDGISLYSIESSTGLLTKEAEDINSNVDSYLAVDPLERFVIVTADGGTDDYRAYNMDLEYQDNVTQGLTYHSYILGFVSDNEFIGRDKQTSVLRSFVITATE